MSDLRRYVAVRRVQGEAERHALGRILAHRGAIQTALAQVRSELRALEPNNEVTGALLTQGAYFRDRLEGEERGLVERLGQVDQAFAAQAARVEHARAAVEVGEDLAAHGERDRRRIRRGRREREIEGVASARGGGSQ